MIYQSISDSFGLFDAFYNYDLLTIDKTFSGTYKITVNDVLSVIHFHHDNYEPIWKQFINSLSETELRQLLFTIGNSLSLDKGYDIYVNDYVNAIVNITTCFHSVTIHEKVFKNDQLTECLSDLKYYLLDNRLISDGISMNMSNEINMNREYHGTNMNRTYRGFLSSATPIITIQGYMNTFTNHRILRRQPYETIQNYFYDDEIFIHRIRDIRTPIRISAPIISENRIFEFNDHYTNIMERQINEHINRLMITQQFLGISSMEQLNYYGQMLVRYIQFLMQSQNGQSNINQFLPIESNSRLLRNK